MQKSENCTKEQNALIHFETTLKNPNLTPVMIIFYQIAKTSILELNVKIYCYDNANYLTATFLTRL